MSNRISLVLISILMLGLAQPAFAQDPADDSAEDLGTSEGGDEEISNEEVIDNSGMLSDEQIRAEQRLRDDETVTSVRSGTDPYEDPSSAYFYVGLSSWFHYTPDFIIGLFTDQAISGLNGSASLDFEYRKDHFSIITSVYWQGFFAEGPFRGINEEDFDTEWINSDLWALGISGTFLWSAVINDYFAVEYGLQIGLSAVGGTLERSEAFPEDRNDDIEDIDGYSRCRREFDPNGAYCEGDGEYGFVEPNWADGGSRPIIFGRLAPMLGVRIKPIKQIAIRINGGFDFLSGFFVGGALAIGVN